MKWLFLGIFVIYGWVEFEAIIIIGDAIGALAAFLGIFVTALIGLSLFRSQSGAVMSALQSKIARGATGYSQLCDGLSLLLGAILMIIPGYATDAIGLLCFVPGLRTLIGAFLMRRLAKNMAFRSGAFRSGNRFSFNMRGRNQAGPSDEYESGDPSDQYDFGGKSGQKSLDEDIVEGDFSEKSHFDKDK